MKKKFTEKQLHILKVAEELIAKKGFEGTSVRNIATAAQVNVAMISYYFGSKEKMMSSLYQYRVQKSREHFSEFSEIIKEGKPEMQMREIIKYLTTQLFKYSYFHGFVTQELRHTDYLQEDLLDFYKICVSKMDDIIKKGVSSGVFTFAPRAEDILSTILGSTLFTIRNKNFIELYIPYTEEEQYLQEAEKKLRTHLTFTTFAILGFVLD